MRLLVTLLIGLAAMNSTLSSAQNRIDIQGAGEMAHYAALQLLPLQIRIGMQDASIVDMELCGSVANAGSFLAIVIPGTNPKSLVLDKLSCGLDRAILARQILAAYPTAQWVGVDALTASWANFKLILGSGESSVYRRDLAVDPVVAGQLTTLGQLLTMQTSSVHLKGASQDISLVAKVWFVGGGVTVSLFPVGAQAQSAQASLPVFDQQAGGFSDTVVKMSYGDVNYFNSQLYPNGFDVKTTAETLHVADLKMSGSIDVLNIVAQLSSPTLPTFSAGIVSNGDDLAVNSVSVMPVLDCNGQAGVARLKCQAQLTVEKTAAAPIAQRLTSIYGGHALRPNGQRSANSITLGSRSYWLKSTVNKCHAANDGLYLMGTLSVEEK